MGVYIKDMEMPKSCEECVIEGHYENSYGDEYGFFCPFGYKAYTRETRDSGRLDVCPLVPVPPHGRLIDADALMHEIDKAESVMEKHGREYACSFLSTSQEISTEWYCVEEMVNNAPTVISADKDGGT